MDVAEVLAMIVERACLFVPDIPVGVSAKSKANFRVKMPKETFTEFEKFPNEALTPVETVFPNEALTSVKKVPVASVASDFVRFNRLISLFKAVSLPTCLV